MSKFKAGDRVRIVSPRSAYRGKQATISKLGFGLLDFDNKQIDEPCYRVVVDGGIYRRKDGLYLAFTADELRPLINPDEEAWQAFKSLHLKPAPALILAKEAV